MVPSHDVAKRLSFGLFEADLHTGELWRAGRLVKLQTQPFKVLTALLERPGEVVSREQLQAHLWGKDAVGDFDHSLGTAINKIRDALGDSADSPRYVETLSRRGYRFIAPVSVSKKPEAGGESLSLREGDAAHAFTATLPTPGDAPSAPSNVSRLREEAQVRSAVDGSLAWSRWTAAVLLALGLAAVAWILGSRNRTAPLLRIEQLTRSGRIAPGKRAMESLPASATDGLRVFVSVLAQGQSELSEADVHTGALRSLSLPHEIQSPMICDLSPDGSTLLLRSHLSPESEQPIWLAPISGGSAMRVANVLGHDAAWMPDGKSILYAAGNQLTLTTLADGARKLFATLPGRAFWLRWSPDGKLLRFTILDPIGHTLALWQVKADGTDAHPLLSGWNNPASECCGVWTGSGKSFVFQSSRLGDGGQITSDLWRLEANSESNPIRVTDGPLNFGAPATPRIGERVYFGGLQPRSVLLRYQPAAKAFTPEQGFLADAARLEYTRNGQWVAWTDAEGRLWQARSDGTERLQVTSDSLQVFLAHWSPDGSQIALMAREPGKAWAIYLVPAGGGVAERPLVEPRNEADPSWSPDGKRIVFGRVNDAMGKEEGSRALQVLTLARRTTTPLPDSDGLFSPRWSPDGQYIAALSLDQRQLVLFDVQNRTWRTLAQTSAADPVWAPDSKAIYFHASLAARQSIYRVSIPTGQLDEIAALSDVTDATSADYFFCGLSPSGTPFVRARTSTGDLYYVDLEKR